MRTRQERVVTDTWRSQGYPTTPLEHWSKRKPTVEPRWAKQQTKKLRPKPTKINSFMSEPSSSLTPDPPALDNETDRRIANADTTNNRIRQEAMTNNRILQEAITPKKKMTEFVQKLTEGESKWVKRHRHHDIPLSLRQLSVVKAKYASHAD